MNSRYLWVKHLTAVNYFNGKKHRNANVAENHFALSMRFLGKQRESWIAINELMARTNGAGGELAARLGLEPRQNESESFVLPLHHRAVKKLIAAGQWDRGEQENGAGDGIRTRNRLFTKQVLYH